MFNKHVSCLKLISLGRLNSWRHDDYLTKSKKLCGRLNYMNCFSKFQLDQFTFAFNLLKNHFNNNNIFINDSIVSFNNNISHDYLYCVLLL